jgi:DNA-binding NarL/FixJ family response regulator
MSSNVKVAFVDDHPVLLKGMAAIFACEDGLDIVAEGASAENAIDIVKTHEPDVLITDLSMPGNVFGAIAEIVKTWPQTRVVVFTAFSSVDSVLKALDAGATGFVLKGGRIEEVIEAVEAVMRGELYITKQYAGQVLGGLRHKETRERLNNAVRLSVREKQIIGHLMKARTNREIASELLISEKTVKYYMTGLMTKLNARNRLEVVFAAQQNGGLDN